MATTQKDIAAHLGLSRISVARALNGYDNVPERTRQRVQEAARELGYDTSSNHEARALVAKRYGKRVPTDIVAVLMPTAFFAGIALPRVPFFASFLEGVEQAAAERQMDLHLCSPPEADRLPRLLERRAVDGIISLATAPDALHTLGLPTIQFGGPAGSTSGMTGLLPNDREGARLATHHLISLGHRRVACLAFTSRFPGAERYHAAAERMEGYGIALAEAGLEVDNEMIIGHVAEASAEAGQHAVAEHLKRGGKEFTGIVCFNDMTAMGAIEALRASGRRVPDDVSVVGFDDVSEQYPFEPKLTSVAFDRFAMGKRAVELIHAARGQDEWQPVPDEVFPVRVVVRDSTKPISFPG